MVLYALVPSEAGGSQASQGYLGETLSQNKRKELKGKESEEKRKEILETSMGKCLHAYTSFFLRLQDRRGSK